jgi:hypothetical protein
MKMPGNNSENNTGSSSGSSTDFKQRIKDLRVAVEKSVDTLKKLEGTGTEYDANDALWVMSAIWNGKEYSTIEATLKTMGHKSGIETSLERLGVI